MNVSTEYKSLIQRINHVHLPKESFDSLAIDIFLYQYKHNPLLKQYAQIVSKTPDQVQSIYDLAFLPIEFFKSHQIKTGDWQSETIFESSGTSGQERSKHHIRSVQTYLTNTRELFEKNYGKLDDLVVLALLPSYLEQANSSLVCMVNDLILNTQNAHSGFYMYDFDALAHKLKICKAENKKVILFGVSYALVDFAQEYKMDLKNVTIIETGGMKGRKKEMTRDALHAFLKEQLNVNQVDSEYGMTELQSQAYMNDGKYFSVPAKMKIVTTDLNDPLNRVVGKAGRLAIIDLANIDSCAFIQTNDLGVSYENAKFIVLGRVDDSDTRGCNLLYV